MDLRGPEDSVTAQSCHGRILGVWLKSRKLEGGIHFQNEVVSASRVLGKTIFPDQGAMRVETGRDSPRQGQVETVFLAKIRGKSPLPRIR